MRRLYAITALPLLAAGAACGTGGVVDPRGGNEVVAGLGLTAAVVEVVHELTDVKQLTIQVTLENRTAAPITIHYQAGCPVRIRLYEPQGSTAVYDESRRPCPVTTLVPLTIAPGGTRILASGTRSPWEVSGDSLSPGAYRATGLLRLVGDAPIEVEAGTYLMP